MVLLVWWMVGWKNDYMHSKNNHSYAKLSRHCSSLSCSNVDPFFPVSLFEEKLSRVVSEWVSDQMRCNYRGLEYPISTKPKILEFFSIIATTRGSWVSLSLSLFTATQLPVDKQNVEQFKRESEWECASIVITRDRNNSRLWWSRESEIHDPAYDHGSASSQYTAHLTTLVF